MRQFKRMNHEDYRRELEQMEAEKSSEADPVEEEVVSEYMADWHYNEGCNYLSNGQYVEAEERFWKAIDICENVYDEEYETPVTIFNPIYRLIELYSVCDMPDEALHLCFEALSRYQRFRRYDYDHYYWSIELTLYIYIGQIHAKAGNTETAQLYVEKSLACINENDI